MAVILPPLISIQDQPVTKGSYLALLCTRPLLGVSSHHEQCGLWSQTDEEHGRELNLHSCLASVLGLWLKDEENHRARPSSQPHACHSVAAQPHPYRGPPWLLLGLRRSCHQTGAELQPEDCRWGERSAGLVALAGVTAGSVTPAHLQQVVLPLVTVSRCQQYWGSRITNSMICAGASGPPCARVTGGPLVCQKGDTWVLTGIVSWGTNDCNVRTPATYTRVSKFGTWINHSLQPSPPQALSPSQSNKDPRLCPFVYACLSSWFREKERLLGAPFPKRTLSSGTAGVEESGSS
ncbi:chymotrypsin-like protease CTRL-1 [Mesoplodon densirostris]|uniref:chymotrypsin-like protease CTRL-1 n=1 Tax=Mesoplodon densirostris TaxID=48708 RepID=UPI0028DC6CCA|nr:chymotrypsin-like protease CTRL-1 [Mesoplodon densirostris]